ncbi:DUF3332 family protein [Psychromonas aquatilis]|uniref:DUF3332 family protein n=1 Tax=Psychromonas aquatilis TaxID=2005072 RepID=A0ABU9GU20_9GAMM
MINKMSKTVVKNVAMVATVASLTGALSACVGSNAVTEKVMQFNLEVVDNRYARGGVNILLTPIYALTLAVDVVVFNSLEFWTGKNPLNGNPHIFDSDVETQYHLNNELDPSLHEAPLKPLTNVNTPEKSVQTVKVNPINEDTIDYDIVYTNGETAVLRGEKIGEEVKFSLNGEFVTMTSIDELEEYASNNVNQSTVGLN